MKTLLQIIAFLILSGCVAGGQSGSRGGNPANVGANIKTPKEDKKEYELIIMDPGFESWFVTRAKPIWYYSNSYYKHWNDVYVSAWNEKVGQAPQYGRDYPFENHINYDPQTNYGVDLNYKLFWYFKYVEEKYGNRYNFPGPGRRR